MLPSWEVHTKTPPITSIHFTVFENIVIALALAWKFCFVHETTCARCATCGRRAPNLARPSCLIWPMSLHAPIWQVHDGESILEKVCGRRADLADLLRIRDCFCCCLPLRSAALALGGLLPRCCC